MSLKVSTISTRWSAAGSTGSWRNRECSLPQRWFSRRVHAGPARGGHGGEGPAIEKNVEDGLAAVVEAEGVGDGALLRFFPHGENLRARTPMRKEYSRSTRRARAESGHPMSGSAPVVSLPPEVSLPTRLLLAVSQETEEGRADHEERPAMTKDPVKPPDRARRVSDTRPITSPPQPQAVKRRP